MPFLQGSKSTIDEVWQVLEVSYQGPFELEATEGHSDPLLPSTRLQLEPDAV